MRPLTEQETKVLFEKLANYTTDLKPLIAPLSGAPDADRYVFRLIKDRVYYVLLSIANLATSVARDNLASVGICLDYTSRSANSSCVSTGESPAIRNPDLHVIIVTQDIRSGLNVYDMSDNPIGFGVSARSTAEARRLDPTGIVVFRQADCGEYLRDEDTLFAG
ncbi:hypothetical protein CIB48_g10536 [Xylaria polymorpha]|nr:hypothetical protein CIB48_g10536 [Xylaria polymorpha]